MVPVVEVVPNFPGVREEPTVVGALMELPRVVTRAVLEVQVKAQLLGLLVELLHLLQCILAVAEEEDDVLLVPMGRLGELEAVEEALCRV